MYNNTVINVSCGSCVRPNCNNCPYIKGGVK